jgi:hypothetical protein
MSSISIDRAAPADDLCRQALQVLLRHNRGSVLDVSRIRDVMSHPEALGVGA